MVITVRLWLTVQYVGTSVTVQISWQLDNERCELDVKTRMAMAKDALNLLHLRHFHHHQFTTLIIHH